MHQWRPLSVDRVVWSFGFIPDFNFWVSWSLDPQVSGFMGLSSLLRGGGGKGANPPPFSPSGSTILSTLTALSRVSRGAFHLTQNSGNFGWHIKWNGPFRFGPTGIFGTSLKVVHFDRSRHFGRSVGPFDKIVVPSTALLHPAYKNNNQTRGSLGRVCATGMYRSIGLWQVELPKFQTGIFVGWKGP